MAFTWHNHNGTVHKTSHLLYSGRYQKVCTCQQLTNVVIRHSCHLYLPKRKLWYKTCFQTSCFHVWPSYKYFYLLHDYKNLLICMQSGILGEERYFRKKILRVKGNAEWSHDKHAFLVQQSNIFSWKHSKMADRYLPIFGVTIKYFNPFKTYTWFSSIFQTLVEIQRNVILYGWAQSKLSYRTGWSLCGWGSQYIHKAHTEYFWCEMLRLRVIESLEYIPVKWLFPFPTCMHHVNQSHRFIFTWTD